MIGEVAAAVMARFNAANPFQAALSGGLFNTHAPQNNPFPFGVFLVVSATPEEEFNRELETVVLQFSVWDRPDNNSPSTLYDLQNKLCALFDWCRLSVAGWNFIAMKRTDQRVLREEAFENLWVLHVTYKVIISI